MTTTEFLAGEARIVEPELDEDADRAAIEAELNKKRQRRLEQLYAKGEAPPLTGPFGDWYYGKFRPMHIRERHAKDFVRRTGGMFGAGANDFRGSVLEIEGEDGTLRYAKLIRVHNPGTKGATALIGAITDPDLSDTILSTDTTPWPMPGKVRIVKYGIS